MRVGRRHVALVLGTLLCAMVEPHVALACKCRGPVPACQEAWESDAVFVGRVTDVRSTPDGDDVDFEVLETFRGVGVGPVRMDRPMGTCAYRRFQRGREYLVFAHGRGRALATTQCSGTSPIEEADASLAYLRQLAMTPTRCQGELRGTVRVGRSELGWAPIADVEVAITGSTGTVRVKTDEGGHFAVSVPPDTYVVTVQPPPGHEVLPTVSAPQLRDARGCVVADVFLRRR